MAGAGYKLFNTGDVLTAQQVNEYLMQQTVMVFANSTARTTALSSVLAEGMVSYLNDTNVFQIYNGSSWVSVAGSGNLIETTFTSSNASWTIPTGVTRIWALVVGGGGGGGASSNATAANSGGGGGAGQPIETIFTVSGDTTLNITVGGGGAGGTAGGKGSSGSASSIVGNTSATTYVTSPGGGGGGGGAAANTAAIAGASGGGNGDSGAARNGGAGGGFCESASNAFYGILFSDYNTARNVGGGGAPTTYAVTGGQGGRTGNFRGGRGTVMWNRAICGGGHAYTDGTSAFGAGIVSATDGAGTNATANTGSGGGAGSTDATTARAGGNGGSGIVVLRYVG